MVFFQKSATLLFVNLLLAIVLLIVAACLLFLPSVLDIAGKSIFGEGKSAAQYKAPTGGS